MAEKEVVVDALPYFDHGYDDSGVREAVSIQIFTLCKAENGFNTFLFAQKLIVHQISRHEKPASFSCER